VIAITFWNFLAPGLGSPLARHLRQANLPLGEAQPWHLAVGQTCNTQGLEELRSPHKLPGLILSPSRFWCD
jgi:hypothetical protein